MVPIAERYAAADHDVELFERSDNSLGLHSLAEFEVDLPSLHQPVLPDDKLRRHRQEIARVAVILFQINADVLIKSLDFGANPENQAERQRITQIDITQHWKRQVVLLGEFRGEPALSGIIETMRAPSRMIRSLTDASVRNSSLQYGHQCPRLKLITAGPVSSSEASDTSRPCSSGN